MSKQDYYKTLGVSKGASTDDLKKAYRNLAMKHHPDRNKGDAESEKKFKEINEAYDVLKDDQKRAAYDRFGHSANPGAASGGGAGGFHHGAQGFDFDVDVENIFDLFGFGGAKKQRGPSQARGSDLQYNLSITLEEAFKGASKNISFSAETKCEDCKGSGSKSAGVKTCHECGGRGAVHMRQGFFTIERPCGSCQGSGQIIKDPCNKCSGKGTSRKNRNISINIPAGVSHGTRLRKTGEGETAPRSGATGDLYIVIDIKPHPVFRVDDRANMHCQVPINFTILALGGEIEIQDIEGEKVLLQVPQGAQYGDQITVKNKGMSITGSKNRGNLVAHVLIQVPKNITSKQRELLQELDKEFNVEKSGSIFEKMKNLWK
jgi:molecular chaperone DnaJ